MRNFSWAVAALMLGVGSSVFAGSQIVLNPSDVIGGSAPYGGSSYNDGSLFNDTNVLDNQTGPITEPDQGGFWLNPDNGPADGFIVIDLGAAYKLSDIQLFNTHNSNYYDRGTGGFTITGANSVADLGTAAAVTLVSGTLNAIVPTNPSNLYGSTATQVTPGQDFAVSNTGAYRYIRFDANSVAAYTNNGAGCCGTNNYGLNEIRFFQASTPEPASLSLIGMGAMGLLARRRRA